MLGLGGLLFVCGILTHCMCTMTDRAAEQCNDIVPIEPVSFTFDAIVYRPYCNHFIHKSILSGFGRQCYLKVDKPSY